MPIKNVSHEQRRFILSLLAIAVLMLGSASMVCADVLTGSDGQPVAERGNSGQATQPAAARLSGLPTAAQAMVSSIAGRHDRSYHAVAQGKGFHAENPRHAMSVDFTSQGVMVHAGKSRWGLTLSGYGFGEGLGAVSASAPNATANRVEYRHGAVTEWYINGPMGLEQGFTLSRAPQERHEGALTLGLAVSGDLAASVDLREDELTLKQGNGEAVLRYCGLTAYDATGRRLNAWLQVNNGQLLLRVDDADAMYPILVDPLVQTAKLTASDGAFDDEFGESVAISGDTVVVGSGATIGVNEDQGAAYVFVKPANGWSSQLIETAKLTASDGAAGDDFGSAVAISGDTVVIGANGAKIGANADQGAAYVFVKPGSGWSGQLIETAKLTASDGAGNDDFGWDVSISGDTVIVGAQQYFSNRHGTAYVFVKPGSGWSGHLTETAKLIASNGANGDAFGDTVSISGDTAVVGADMAQKYTNIGWGAVYVFVKPGSGWGGNLTETAKLTLSNSEKAGYFAVAAAVSGDTVVVGADYAPPTLPLGAAYVFVKPASGWAGQVTENAKLTSSDERSEDNFSYALAISGDTVIVGANLAIGGGSYQLPNGEAYVFVKPASGWGGHLTEAAKLIASDGADLDYFGVSVAISGNMIVAGASGARIGGNADQGAAYVFGKRSYASLNGAALVPDPYSRSKVLGYLSDGEAFALQSGNVFSFAPIQLPHGAIIKKLRCVVKDNTPRGSIHVNLLRGPINTIDAVTPVQIIASAATFPATASPVFQEISKNADPNLAVVDNTKYGYFFRVDFLASPALVGPNILLSLRGCIVDYEH